MRREHDNVGIALVLQSSFFSARTMRRELSATTSSKNDLIQCFVVVDEERTKIRVLQRMNKILNEVEPLEVRPYLFQEGVFPVSEYENISERCISCRKLISVLERKDKEGCAFQHMKIILEDCYGFGDRQEMGKEVLKHI